jgi:hypothetical protein
MGVSVDGGREKCSASVARVQTGFLPPHLAGEPSEAAEEEGISTTSGE